MTDGTLPASRLLNLQQTGSLWFFTEAKHDWHSGMLLIEVLEHSSMKPFTSLNRQLFCGT